MLRNININLRDDLANAQSSWTTDYEVYDDALQEDYERLWITAHQILKVKSAQFFVVAVGKFLNDSKIPEKYRALNNPLQEIGSKLNGTPKWLCYHTSKDKTPEQINKDNRRRSMKQVDYNEHADDSMYEQVESWWKWRI